MILSHTGSINDGPTYNDFLMTSYNAVDGYSIPLMKDILQEGRKYYNIGTYLNKRPGSYFTYSNLNFAIAGTLIERLSG